MCSYLFMHFHIESVRHLIILKRKDRKDFLLYSLLVPYKTDLHLDRSM